MGTKKDLRMWDLFLRQYNEVTMFLPTKVYSQQAMSIQMATNDTNWSIIKYATWANRMWGSMFHGKLSGLLKEMVPFVALINVFGTELANRKLHLQCKDT